MFAAILGASSFVAISPPRDAPAFSRIFDLSASDDDERRSNPPAHSSYMSTESSVAAPFLPGPSASCAPERASRWVRPRVNSGRKFSIRIHNWSSRNARNDRSNHSYNSVGRSTGVSRHFIKEKPLRFTAPVNLQGKHGMRSGTPFACRVGK